MPPTTTSQIDANSDGGFLRGLALPVVFIGAILVFVVPIPPRCARRLAFGQLDGRRSRAFDDAGDPYSARVQRLPDHPAHNHTDAVGLERRDGSPRADAGR